MHQQLLILSTIELSFHKKNSVQRETQVWLGTPPSSLNQDQHSMNIWQNFEEMVCKQKFSDSGLS